MKPLICIKNLYITIDWNSILESINLDIFEWEIISIIWLNWSGKTTLLKAIIWVYKPTKGTITKNTDKIWYVPQKIDFEKQFPLSVYELINAYTNKNRIQIMQWLEILNASNLIDKKIWQLSWWQIQKVLIINAILSDAKIILLDEPTTWIDIIWEKNFYENILTLKELYNISIVMVSHDTHNVFDKSNKIYCLDKTICCSGQPQDIIKSHKFKEIFWKHLVNYIHNHDK